MSKAKDVIAALEAEADPTDTDYVARFYKGGDQATEVMGVRMPKVFPIAKRFQVIAVGRTRQTTR